MGEMNTVIHKTVLLMVLCSAFLMACGPSVGRATGVTEPASGVAEVVDEKPGWDEKLSEVVI